MRIRFAPSSILLQSRPRLPPPFSRPPFFQVVLAELPSTRALLLCKILPTGENHNASAVVVIWHALSTHQIQDSPFLSKNKKSMGLRCNAERQQYHNSLTHNATETAHNVRITATNRLILLQTSLYTAKNHQHVFWLSASTDTAPSLPLRTPPNLICSFSDSPPSPRLETPSPDTILRVHKRFSGTQPNLTKAHET